MDMVVAYRRKVNGFRQFFLCRAQILLLAHTRGAKPTSRKLRISSLAMAPSCCQTAKPSSSLVGIRTLASAVIFKCYGGPPRPFTPEGIREPLFPRTDQFLWPGTWLKKSVAIYPLNGGEPVQFLACRREIEYSLGHRRPIALYYRPKDTGR